MDNNNKNESEKLVDGWTDDSTQKIDLPDTLSASDNSELGPDEFAIAQAGLVHPDDVELEQIIAETLADQSDIDPAIQADAQAEVDAQFQSDDNADISEDTTAQDAADASPDETAEDSSSDVTTDTLAILLADLPADILSDTSDTTDIAEDVSGDASSGVTTDTLSAILADLPADVLDNTSVDSPDSISDDTADSEPSGVTTDTLAAILADLPADALTEQPTDTTEQAADEDAPSATTEAASDAPPKKRKRSKRKAETDPNVRKVRPKRKKGYGLFGLPHLVSTAIWLLLILAIGVSLGRTLWLCAKDVLALGKESFTVSITITESDTIDDVAQKLKNAGLIEYPGLFKKFLQLTGKGDHMLRGTITFNDMSNVSENDMGSKMLVYDYNAIANALSYRGNARVTLDVMIPEGYNCAQIFALLEEKGVCTVSELERFAAVGELDSYWFLDGIERGHKYCLEGFLFPDTYEFYMGDDPSRVIHKLLNGFEQRFTERMIDKYVALNAKTGLNLSIRQVITMASIIEKEKASGAEGYSVSSVFYNRLTNSGTYPYLQSDATIKYDVDFRSQGELITDAQINASPYNTYTQKGLPAGPIANPGLSSLDAALDPEDTDYFFFIFDEGAGVHRFSKTLKEHNEWAKKLGLA